MGTNTDTWRLRAVEAAIRAFSRPVIDRTPDGERWVLENLIRPVWPEKHDYRDGSFAWCGLFLTWCWRQAGFRPPWVLSSVGRILYPFAGYDRKAYPGPHWCTVIRPGGQREAMLVHDMHLEEDALRLARVLTRISVKDARPGDVLLRQRKSGGWHGHVMMVLGHDDETITVVDGNGKKSWGPGRPAQERANKDGRWEICQRDGVGIRSYHVPTLLRQPGYWWLVCPSILDFSDSIVSYHMSYEEAQKAAETS